MQPAVIGLNIRACGETGRHVGFRFQCFAACRFKSCQAHHEGTVAMIQVAAVPFNFSYLEVLDFKDFLSSVGSMLRENAETKGNFLILGVHFII